MANQSGGGIHPLVWVAGAVVVIAVVWWAMSSPKKKADLGNPTKIVMMQKSPSIVPA